MAIRQLEAEKNALKIFGQQRGKMPETPEEWSALHKIAYPNMNDLPDEFKNEATESFYQGTGGQGGGQTAEERMRESQARLEGLSKPNTALDILQDAIRTKVGHGKEPLGTSELFDKAGLTGMASLGQSLDARRQELDMNLTEFRNTINTASGVYKDMATTALTRYEGAVREYEREQDIAEKRYNDAQARAHDFEILRLKEELDKARRKDIYENEPSLDDQQWAIENDMDIINGRYVPKSRVTPTGNMQTINYNDRDINVDGIAIPSLKLIHEQSQELGGLLIGAVDTSSYRTIEQQQELYDTFINGGPQAAAPGQSLHEKGMAIDLFPDQEYIEQMRPIMEANGWVQNAGDADLGHFEYVGTAQEANTYSDNNEFSYNEKIDTTKLPNIGKKSITDKSARMSNLPFGVTQEQANWIMERRPGNIEFQRLKTKDYADLAGLLELKEDITEIRELKIGIDTGPIASRSMRTLRYTGISEDTDYSTLEIKTGKNLADYIKSISGGAVSNEEAERLMQNIPHIKMQDQQFINSLDDYENDFENILNAKLSQYNIEDEASLRKAILGQVAVDSDLTGNDLLRAKYNYE